MGLLNAIAGSRVYLDTNIFLYALEGHAEYADDVSQLFDSIDGGALDAITSELTLAEALVKPYREQNIAAEAEYLQTIRGSRFLSVVPISREILLESARIRAVGARRLPDAIHAATARLARCTSLVTNDRRFPALADVTLVLLSDAVSS